MTMDTQETTLLPCPFCGSASVRTFAPTCKRGSEYDPTDRAFPIVRCGDCFAEACGENWDNSCKTAIKSWNTRAPSPALALAQEALRQIVCARPPDGPTNDIIQKIEDIALGYLKTIAIKDEAHLPSADREHMEAAAWQPIETAPKDGTRVLIWNEEGHEIAAWDDFEPDGPAQPGYDAGWIGTFAFPGRTRDAGFPGADHWISQPQGQPTHWMALIEPPRLTHQDSAGSEDKANG